MRANAIPILLYHSVSETAPAGQEAYTVRPSRFAEHVRAIADAGRTPLTVAQLAEALRGRRELPERPVAVTFDDGFADVTDAVERLLDADLAASVYVTSGWVDRPAMLTAAEIRGLSELGEQVEVGAHSVTHPRLDELAPEYAFAEIAESKRVLEDVLGAPVASFAYPHGAYDRRVRGWAIQAGFLAAAAVKNALSHRDDDLYALARWTVTADVDAVRIGRVLAGEGAPLAWRGERARTRGYRLVRRLRRRVGRATPPQAPCR